MKRIALFFGILLLVASGAYADKGMIKGGTAFDPAQITVTPPQPEGWDECAGSYVYVYWDSLLTGPPTTTDSEHWQSNYSGADSTQTSITPVPDGDDVLYELVIDNEYVVNLKKRIFIKLEGTVGTPTLESIQGINLEAVQDTSIGGASGVDNTSVPGTIVIRGTIWPQPAKVEAIIRVPGTSSLKGVWVSECCDVQSSPEISVPSITTWGAAILVALLLISGLYIIRRRKVTA